MYFLKRCLFLIPLLLVISFLAFGLMRLAPGGRPVARSQVRFDDDRGPRLTNRGCGGTAYRFG